MVINVRSLQIKAGKGEEALEWSKELVQYVNDNLAFPHPVQLIRPIFGSDTDRMVWVGTYENLGQFEEKMAIFSNDEGVKERLKKIDDLFEPHSFQNQVYRVVE